MNLKHIIFLLLILPFGCNVGPRYEYPVDDIPEEWKHHTDQEVVMDDVCHWWEIFGDEKLNALIEQALSSNYTLKGAIERVIQARAEAGIVGSELYPQINTNPSYSNEMFLTKAYGVGVISNDPNIKVPVFREHLITLMLPFNLSWELDLWGRLRNLYCSAVYQAEAEYEAFGNLALLMTTDLADRYFQLRSLDQQIDLYTKTIATRTKALKINQDRYDLKIITYDPVSQAMLDLANVEADYFESKRLRERLENSIATLIGVPSSLFFIEHSPLADHPPPILAGLPSDVLMQRPDIRQAERERASSHALVRAAYGAFFPSFSLTGALGFSSPDLRHFLSAKSRYWAVGASAFQSIFDGGYLTSNLQMQWAKFHEADDDYKQLVLVALEEVNTGLSDIEWLQKESEKLAISVKAATTTYQIVYDRYFEGIGYYLAVVDSERDQLNAQRAYNNVQGLRYSATVQLIKALGGKW